MLYRSLSVLLPLLISFTFSLSAQIKEDWQIKAETGLIQLLKSDSEKDLSATRIELWTVSPGVTVTTAFGHAALRIFQGKEYGDKDYYLDFGVYDPSPGFLWRFLKGDAAFFVNVIPTDSAYRTWDGSGRGITATELKIDNTQKRKLFAEIIKTYDANQKGYTYENFTNNCVTFLRDIISKGLTPLELKEIEEGRDTWRERVYPYSNTIVWLNINETLLFDHDTDKKRNPHELIYLPNDLLKSLQQTSIPQETKIILKDRWQKEGKSSAIWMVIFLAILLFSFPAKFLQLFERIAEILYGFVAGIGGTLVTLVYLFTSFSFMNETIAWLAISPIDFFVWKKYENFKNKKLYFYLIGIRLLMLIIALILKFTFYQQTLGNLLFLSSFFYLCLLYKKRNEFQTLFLSNK
ncbi:hypothetical protein LPTSP3_g23480 [Leptospira kobayashii]|uniref:Lnb N-terminal periplasmic domain-containing protein n=1 Tax=Leptospira kobayashii TaxID=1917830 RepID=A0ABM7UKJ8_9LEPT|nr:DUF4105 domain-containing protein [Leptospira kobayashii]BDA79418.1 hypothetical protein LPTSP3_g23480 [Leptospira kobayashii]